MNKNILRIKYILFDILAAVIVWTLFMFFRRAVNDAKLFEDVAVFIPNFNNYTIYILYPSLCVLMHYLTGYYVYPVKQSRLTEIFATIFSSALISIVIFFVLLLDDIVINYFYYYQSLMVLFALQFLVTYTFRCVQSANIRSYFKKKKWTINTLIIGTGSNAKKIADGISNNLYFNTVVGFIKIDPREREIHDSQVVGTMHNIQKAISELDVKEAIIALDDANEHSIFNIVNNLYQYNIEIKFTPRLYEILTGKARMERYGLNPLVSISRPTMSDWQICIKRTSDIILSALSLIILSPLILYFFIAIKIDSKGPAIFKQERIGLYGKTFNIYKFRTMLHNAETGLPKLSSPDDERITRIGKNMRKYRFDEIMQFVNVLKGDMSIVGPRPERKYYIDQIIKEAPYYCLLYRIRPGLTSWGPIKIGYSDTIEKMIERLNYDIVYMENMSLLVDIEIILSTLEIIFKGKGI